MNLAIQPLLAYEAIAYVVVGALSAIGGGSAVAGAIQVAITAASLVYSASQQKKAKAAARAQAERLKKEQARALAEQQKALRELSKLGDKGSFRGNDDLTVMVRRSVVNRRFVYGRARVGGIWLYIETTGPSNDFVHLILGLCEGPIKEIEAIQFDDEIVTLDSAGNGTGKWAGHLNVRSYVGEDDQVADAGLVAESAGKWTEAHTLKGIAYLYLKFRRNTGIFPTLPEVSAIIKGKADIYDPRTNLADYTDNAALCLADYLSTPLRGPSIPRDDIEVNALIHAANVCDEPIPLLAGGSERRYTVSGAIDLGQNVEDNIAQFTQAMGGDVIHASGKYEIQAGEYRTPTFEITPDMFVEGFTVSNLQPRKDRANVVKGTYVAEANRWQRFDFPSVSRDAYIAADGGETVRDLTLDMVQSGSHAQRLASIALEQSRRSRTLQCTCNLKALPAKCGGTVFVTIPRYFNRAPMRVVESTFVVGNNGALVLKLSLVETAPEIYDWDRTREKQVNIPPQVNAKGITVAAPAFSPEAGDHPAGSFPLAISITSLTAGANIRWSLTATPEDSDDGTAYTGPVSVAAGQTLYARGFRDGYEASQPAIGAYVAI